jgi:LacI family transcriptional regulator
MAEKSPAISIKDVARFAGVAVSTVSLTINHPDRVKPQTRDRVQAAIKTLGFVRNAAARQLRRGSSGSIGVLMREVRNPFYISVASGAEETAGAAGLLTQSGYSEGSADDERHYLELFLESRSAGLIVAPVSDDLGDLLTLQRRGVPVVIVDRAIEDRSFSSVFADPFAGGYLAAGHLADTGRTRIAFVGPRRHGRPASERFAGAARAVEDRGTAGPLQLIAIDSYSVEAGREAADLILGMPAASRPDGVFAVNDLVAIGLLQRLRSTGGVSVPDDIAVIGYDDIPYAGSALIGLSTIRQPSRAIGQKAAELLIAELDGGIAAERTLVRYEPELVVRASSGG